MVKPKVQQVMRSEKLWLHLKATQNYKRSFSKLFFLNFILGVFYSHSEITAKKSQRETKEQYDDKESYQGRDYCADIFVYWGTSIGFIVYMFVI